jgi:c-di-GMP-binding flagellar brake protein YcgR
MMGGPAELKLAMPPTEKCDRMLNNERRSHLRYPVSIDLAYRLVANDPSTRAGRGTSVNISSGGLLFEAEDQLPTDTRIELTILWPARINDDIELTLYVTGETVRVEGKRAAVKFDHSTFRLAGTSDRGKVSGNGY